MRDGRDPAILNLAHWFTPGDLVFAPSGGLSVRAGPFLVPVLRIANTEDVRVAIGDSAVVATATSTLVLAPGTEYVPWVPGEYIAAVGNGASGGTLNITQCL